METGVVSGNGVVAGVAYGPVVWVRPRPELPGPGELINEDDRDAEIERFVTAADTVADRLQGRAAAAQGQTAEVLTATAAMVRDRGWRKAARKQMMEGHHAEYAVVGATDKFVAMFEKAGGLMAERTTDLRDIRDRVIAQLQGTEEPGLPNAEQPSVLFAEDLAPADTAGLDTSVFTALVTELGGPTSHTAIIARQLGLPCIVAAGAELKEFRAGEMVLVDGGRGTIDRDIREEDARAAVDDWREQAQRIASWRGPAATQDGHRIQLLANVAGPKAAEEAAGSPAEGIGLYRTELSFLSSATEPSVAAQSDIYRDVLDVFAEGKVVIRTLDAGSDKPISYATLSDEENPALGVRGLRLARGNEGLLTRQLDAIAQAATGRSESAPTWVMAPMVATAAEATWFADRCRERGLVPGAMIEIPAAALMADTIMTNLDFVSIGTNDLTQYAMAADRLSPHLAELTDAWQPAVLKLIDMTCRSGEAHDVPVGVCGEAASDPLLACVLVGMGVSSLSAAHNALAAVGSQLAQVTLEACQEMASAALSASGAADARAAARAVLES